MTLHERIRACRESAGLSQEKLAELVGVSRQAVTKWELGQSAPGTENLFRLAEIFGTTVDLLLTPETAGGAEPSAAEPEPADQWKRIRKNTVGALRIAAGYLGLYLLGRVIWCDLSQSSLLGWLVTVRPAGAHSYLYGWLLSSRLFWYAMAVSVLPSLWGRRRFSRATLAGFVIGLAAGMLFGPNPAGAATGQTHYGWLIWGIAYLISMAVGTALERRASKARKGGKR